MISASRIISDVKGEFQGGSSLSVSWNSLLRRAARNVLDSVSIDNLKLKKAVYGGITKEQFVYLMPPDIVKPVALYTNDGRRKWEFQPPKHFFSQEAQREQNKFTVYPVNGIVFLVVKHSDGGGITIIDELDTTANILGTATAVLNDRDYVSGQAAIQALFTDSGLTVGRTLDAPIDISTLSRGTIIIPARISNILNLASIEYRLQTDDSNYYKFLATDPIDPEASDVVFDSLITGWNFIRLSMENLTRVGSPDASNITSWLAVITAKTGKTVTVVLDRMTLQKSYPLWLEGYCEDLFIDGTTGERKKEVDYTKDFVNIYEELENVLHYELCILTQVGGNKQKDEASGDFIGQLKRAYQNYYGNHPSEEAPLSYNILPQMNRSTPHSDVLDRM